MVSGYLKSTDCGAKRAGIAILYVAEVGDVTYFTKNTSGEDWTAVTMETSAVFKKYEFKREEAELTMNLTVENGSSRAENSIEFNLEKLSQSSRDAVQELADKSVCGLIAIAVTNQGDKWVLGYDNEFQATYYLELQSGNGTSGRAMTDAQGFTATLGNSTVELPRTFTGTVPV